MRTDRRPARQASRARTTAARMRLLSCSGFPPPSPRPAVMLTPCGLLAAILLLAPPEPAIAPQSPTAPQSKAVEKDDPVLTALRAQLDEAKKAKEAKDLTGARKKITNAIEQALADLKDRED